MSPDTLNEQFSIDGKLDFVTSRGGWPLARIDTGTSQATVSLYGAQVLSWRPRTTRSDVLFQSKNAHHVPGKAVKAGIPICWPWFGPDPEQRGRPAHGYARIRDWTLSAAKLLQDGCVQMVFDLKLNSQDVAGWRGDAHAELKITVGETLSLSLTTRNHTNEAMLLTQAFHTYFSIGDIAQATVDGLHGCKYIDKVNNDSENVQHGMITIDAEVDRIYSGVSDELAINDPAAARTIQIRSTGSNSAVVWNPWRDIAAQMADLEDEDYLRMLCVETSNAGVDVVSIQPGSKHTLSVTYEVNNHESKGN